MKRLVIQHHVQPFRPEGLKTRPSMTGNFLLVNENGAEYRVIGKVYNCNPYMGVGYCGLVYKDETGTYPVKLA